VNFHPIRIFALLVIIAIAATFSGCAANTGAQGKQTTPKLEAQLASLPTPQGVDAALFEQLKAEFARVMREEGKSAASPPAGAGNAPASAYFTDDGGGDYTLRWAYRNKGDYDQSGTVGITDITPLAVHFGHAVGADGLDAVIHALPTGTVGISDVTPIAQNFGVDCARYDVEWATSTSGPWTSLASVNLSSGTGKNDGWMAFTYSGAFDPANWYRITPFDSAGSPGESCAPIQVTTTGGPPEITNITPLGGPSGSNATFIATVTGQVDSYAWDFAGGATPSTSSEASPTVQLGAENSYSASLTVTNSFGSDMFSFWLNVTPAGPSWSFHLIEAGPYVGQKSELCIAEGVPMVAYIQELDKHIRYARANVPMPTQSSDWTLSNINEDNAETWDGRVSIAEIDGHAAVMVNQAIDQDAYYFYQNTYPADSPADWTGSVIDTFAIEVGTLVQDALLPFPAVCFYDGDMVYAEATSAAPTGPADWFQVAVDTVGFVGSNSRLAIHNENPYLLYRSSSDEVLRLAYVNHFDRMNPAAWTITDVDQGDKPGEWNDLWFEGSDVLIAYTREPLDIEMHFALGPDTATSMGDFSRMPVEAIYRQDVGQYVSQAVYNGKLGMAYVNASEINLNFTSADYTPGSMPANWQYSVYDDGGGAGGPLINGDTHMMVWNNTLILVYRRNDGLWFCTLPLS
jgi:PKD repeat protein